MYRSVHYHAGGQEVEAWLSSPERPAVIHGVQHVFHPPTWLPGWPSEDRRSRMIFIARGIPPGWVEALLAAIEAEVSDVSASLSL